MDSETLRDAIGHVRSSIESACARAGRDPSEVLLVAVTKTVSLDVIRQARAMDLDHFGENYATELAAKAAQVQATWHFIGRLQRGTAHRVADHAQVVHSAEPGRALQRLARRASSEGRSIRCLIQTDFTGGRQGVPPEETPGAVQACAAVEGIAVVGLMTLPPWTDDPEATRPYFARLCELRDRIHPRHPEVVELSMGMSGDYEVAVEEGATMLRIGTALFGSRPRTPGGATPGEEG
jgi:pyridoxal phosphate enzyme (YggS family)